jgi:DNA polymerase III subunit epsilon
VRLSRKVFPGLRSYSLSNLKKEFGIVADKSHRALDDTLATVQLFERILEAQAGNDIKALVNHGVKETKLPPNITLERLHTIPEACGVYYLHDAKGDVIYVGKSLNIRKRLFEHFSDLSPKGEKMRTGVDDISYEITGSELIALLHESAEIKRLQPRINRALRKRDFNAAIFTYTDQRGYRCLAIGKKTAKNAAQLQSIADYPKLDHAKAHLMSLVRQFELCHKLANLDFHEHACFHYGLKQCRGACVSEESPESYNERVAEALRVLDKRLQGSFILLEPGRTPDELGYIIVEDGKYLGFGYADRTEAAPPYEDLLENLQPCPITDPDAGRIIQSWKTDKKR